MAEIQSLLEGYKAFYKEYFASGHALYEELAQKGQSPKTAIIACSDSRVDPSIVTQANPGDIFVIRNVANLVPSFQPGQEGMHGVSAALEFAVCFLEVQHVVVLGHSHCSGIDALLHSKRVSENQTSFISSWVHIAAEAKEKALQKEGEEDVSVLCGQEAVLVSLANLLTFPWIRERVEQQNLQIHGWYFFIEDGLLQQYNPISEQFEAVATE